MILFELKKIMSKRIGIFFVLLFLLSCFFFFIQFKGVNNASTTQIKENLYQKVSGKITEKTSEEIEQEKEELDNVLAREYEMEDQYKKGNLDIDSYMKYRDSFHAFYNKEKEIDDMYERYVTAKKNGWYMVFDSYYNQLYNMQKVQWGLILSLIFVSLLLVNCESEQLSKVLYNTKKGCRGILKAKILTMLLLSSCIAFFYNLTEYAVMASFSPFEQLNAPVQSIECLAVVKQSITIGQWMILTVLLRLLVAAVLGLLLYGLQYVVKNNKISLIIFLILVIAPILLGKGIGIENSDILSKVINVYPLFS
jgi:hypothetical protein